MIEFTVLGEPVDLPNVVITPIESRKVTIKEKAKTKVRTIECDVDDNNCWICTSHKKSKRYYNIQRNGKHYKLHRYLYKLVHGEIPSGKYALHTCDNVFCINPNHIVLGTLKDNMIDMISKGRGTNKLNADQVREIKKDSRPNTEIAKEYGVSRKCICHIKNGRTWNHVN